MSNLLLITTGRHPFQVGVLGGTLGAAAGVLFGPARPASLAATMTEPYVAVWLTLLLGGALAGQIGIWWRGDIDTGLIVEAGGVLAVGCATSIYVAALAVVQGWPALAAICFIGGIAASCWWRVGQIALDVRKIWRAQKAGVTANVKLLVDPPAAADDTQAGP